MVFVSSNLLFCGLKLIYDNNEQSKYFKIIFVISDGMCIFFIFSQNDEQIYKFVSFKFHLNDTKKIFAI